MAIHSQAYTSSSFLQQFPELVLSRGGNLTELCHSAGLQEDVILGKPRLIPFKKFIQLLEITATELNFPDISLALCSRQDINVLGPLSAYLLNCNSAHDAFEKIRDALQLIVSNITMEFHENDNNLEMRFIPQLPELQFRPQFQIYLLASSTLVHRELTENKAPLRGCFFTFEDSKNMYAEYLSQYFKCPIALGSSKISLTMGKEFLDFSADEISQRIKQKLHTQLEARADISRQVSEVIQQCLISGNAKLSIVAKALGYSERTLHRRLESSNTSFNALLNASRLELANQYLEIPYYNLADIAHLLGYKHLSAFSRSYKRWSGITPQQARRLLR